MKLQDFRQKVFSLKPIAFLLAISFVSYIGWVLVDSIANPAFGTLPKQEFRSLVLSNPEWITEALNTPGIRKAGVYKVKRRGFTATEASELAKKIGFVNPPQIISREVLTWKSTDAYIYVNLKSGEVNYKKAQKDSLFGGTERVNIDRLVNKAIDYLGDFGVARSLITVEKPELEFLVSTPTSVELQEVDQSKANVIGILYQKEVEKLPIVNLSGPETIRILITTKGELFSLNYSNLDLEIDDASYPLKGEGEVKKEINEKGAYVVKYRNEEDATINDPTKVFVSKGKVVLFNDSKTPYIQPIYLFQGLVYKTFKSSQVEIYYPAVSDKYLK